MAGAEGKPWEVFGGNAGDQSLGAVAATAGCLIVRQQLATDPPHAAAVAIVGDLVCGLTPKPALVRFAHGVLGEFRQNFAGFFLR
jgi:hypothetical protein